MQETLRTLSNNYVMDISLLMTHRESDEKLAKNISKCLITIKKYQV